MMLYEVLHAAICTHGCGGGAGVSVQQLFQQPLDPPHGVGQRQRLARRTCFFQRFQEQSRSRDHVHWLGSKRTLDVNYKN